MNTTNMAHRLVLIPLFSLSLLESVQAEPAVLHDNLLLIPEGAVIGDIDSVYYKNIRLDYDGKGSFRVMSAEALSPVQIESVAVVISESLPLQASVEVSGIKSVPCVHLETPAILRGDQGFNIVLAESRLGPEESCIAIISPFETSIALDVTTLPDGDYTVKVNGVQTQFTLQRGN
ncbi:MAG: hypothetical protein RQ899_14985 [Pseudomonadales bacterium]|nr:hypothetical protein [Pseudomonadales bacterium]